MKRFFALIVLSIALCSCSAVHELSGRVVTTDGELILLPDGRVEITVNPQTGK